MVGREAPEVMRGRVEAGVAELVLDGWQVDADAAEEVGVVMPEAVG